MTRLLRIKLSPKETAKRKYESHKNWWITHPVERKAHAAVAAALNRGELKKTATCEWCGAKGTLHGHHEDYYKALEVVWLCHKCHGTTRRTGRKWWRQKPITDDHIPVNDTPQESNFSLYLKVIERTRQIASRVEEGE